MKLNDIVTTIDTSNLLKAAGYNRKAIFSYYRNNEGHIYIGETEFQKDSFIAYAYTTSELTASLPSMFDIDSNTYVALTSGYSKLTESEVEEYEGAELICFKAVIGTESQYGVKYVVGKGVIAFGQNTKGEYRNLICFSPSEAESRAAMILALVEEGKV